VIRSAEIAASEKTPGPRGAAPRGALRAVLHALILFHLAAVVGWSFTTAESPAPLNKLVRARFRHYMMSLGLTQGWNMFANPPMSNIYLDAAVTLQDGSQMTWPFPRMGELGYFERYRKERYRKWAVEHVWASGNMDARVAEAAARFAARQVERPGNEARRVELVRYREQIDSPKRGPLRPYRQPATTWDRLVFYTWTPEGGGVVTTQPASAPATAPATSPAPAELPREAP